MGRLIEDLIWPGGEHDFALRFGELEILQQRCDAGPEYILKSLMDGSWRQDYIFQTLRLGLIGGGMDDDAAKRLIHNLRDDAPLRELSATAQAILVPVLIGNGDDKIDETPGEDAGATPQPPEENGGSQKSMEPEPSSVSRPETSEG